MTEARKKLMADIAQRAEEVVPYELWILFDIMLVQGHCVAIYEGEDGLVLIKPKENKSV